MSGSLRVMAGVFAAVLLPLVAGGLLVLVEPPAFTLRQAPTPGGCTLPDGATLSLTPTRDRAAASRLAEVRYRASPMPYAQVNDLRRYRTPGGRHGIIAPVDSYLLEIEAADEAAIDRAVDAVPFLVRNRGILATMFGPGLGLTIAGILAYAVLCSVLFFRALGRTASRPATSGVERVDERALRERLSALTSPGRVLRDDAREFAVASPRPGMVLRMRFDDRRGIVRAVLTSRSVRARGLSIAWSFHRTVPAPGDWTEPLADAVVAAGWHWRPVITFLRPIGG